MRYLNWCIIICIIYIFDKYLIHDRKLFWYFLLILSIIVSVGELFVEHVFIHDAFMILLGISIVKIVNLYNIEKQHRRIE